MAEFYERPSVSQCLDNDSLNAIVIDAGSETIRAGYANTSQNQPQLDIPSVVGVVEEPEPSKFYVGTENLVPQPNMRILPIFYDGLIDNFEAFEKTIEYVISTLKCDPSEHMFFFSEPVHQNEKRRNKILELMFEKLKAKAVYMKTSAALQLVSAGLTSGLVIDSGASHTTVTPVSELYALKSSAASCDIGGNLVMDEIMILFEEKEIQLVPPFYVKEKYPVEPDTPPMWKTKSSIPEVRKSYLKWSFEGIAKEFAKTMLTVNPHPLNSETDFYTKEYFSFPDGLVKGFKYPRYKIPECLFDTEKMTVSSDCVVPIQELVFSVLDSTDPSFRHVLQDNMIVTGGNSQIPGFHDRLEREINEKLGIIKLKKAPSSNRRFDAYIGAAMMATNTRMIWNWYSAEEYKQGDRRIHEL